MNESESNRQEDHPMPDEYQYDRYDAAYQNGYADGLAGRPKRPSTPADDTDVNYQDGWRDGRFKREQEEGA